MLKLFPDPKKHTKFTQTLLKAIADTGGHPATIEGLQRWVGTEKDSDAMKLLCSGEYNVPYILSLVRTSHADPKLPWNVLASVIRAEEVTPNTVIVDGLTFSELEQHGVLFRKDGKPCISNFLFLEFSEVTLKNPPKRNLQELFNVTQGNESKLKSRCQTQDMLSIDEMAAHCLMAMLDPKIIWKPGEQLETFITWHPVLHSLASIPDDDGGGGGDGQWKSLKKLFGYSVFGDGFPNLEVFVPRRLHVINFEGQYKTFAMKITEIIHSKPELLKVLKGTLIHCCHNNPGFETAFVLQSRDSDTKKEQKPVIVAIEARCSDPISTTTLPHSQITEKMRNTTEQTQQMASALKATVVLAVIAIRHVTAPAIEQLPVNVMFIGKDNYLGHIGPAFAPRFSIPIIEDEPSPQTPHS